MSVTKFLLEDIKTTQPKWYGNVQRMEEGRLSKKVMKWSPPGRRKLMEEKGLMEENWNDRDKWKKIL